jgi:hypothetical protein
MTWLKASAFSPSVFFTIFLYNGKQFGSDELEVLICLPRETHGDNLTLDLVSVHKKRLNQSEWSP